MRVWLHQRLVSDAALTALLYTGADEVPANAEDAVFESHSLENTPDHKPFVVHDMGNDTSERLAEGHSAHRQFVTIYVHDDKESDYTLIDQVIQRIKELLDNAPSSAGFGIIACHFLETSRDLEDDQMGTLVKYARFQIVGA